MNKKEQDKVKHINFGMFVGCLLTIVGFMIGRYLL